MNRLNNNYSRRERVILWANHAGKLLPEAQNELRQLRRKMCKMSKPADRVIIYNDSGDSYIIIYKDPFEFDGTREELRAELWDQIATPYENRGYDCTAQHFTTGFKVGHICGNLWKVAEYMSVDV